MSKHTKTIFYISVLYCVGLAVTLGCALFLISVQGAKLEQSRVTISEHLAKEAAYNNVIRLLETTESDRRAITGFFLTEKDTISFISELETAAKHLAIELETTDLAVVEAVTKSGSTTPATLSVGLRFTGNETAVKKFVVLLENIPYHKSLPDLTLVGQAETGAWEGKSKLIITLTP